MFPAAFAPGSIGTLDLPHRILMGSMHLNFEADPRALGAFYAERAAGGAALIVTGGTAVSREGSGGRTYLVSGGGAFLDAAGAALEAVHDAGGRLALQLFHAGRYAFEDTFGLQPLAPSPVWSAFSRSMPAAMNQEQIARTLEDFAGAARLARELGFDAVEIMGSEGYLVNQFASAATNLRDDEWGGDAVRRRAFPLAVLAAVRDAAGPGLPVIFRLSGDDLMPGSSSPEEYRGLAAALAAAGADALNVGIGWHESRVPTVQALVPHGQWLPVAALIRAALAAQACPVPVIGSNRINSLAQADAALAAGQVDFVSLARPFLADPRIVAKSAAGRPELVNTCIACNEACIDRSLGTEPVSCLVNPRAGREAAYPVEVQAAGKGPVPGAGPAPLPGTGPGPGGVRLPAHAAVAVAGAGPAGLQAAATLASHGVPVVLFEAGPGIGGQFLLAGKVPGKADFLENVRYFSHELPRLGVRIRTGVRVRAADLAGFSHVVVATGVLPRTVPLPGQGQLPVLDYRDAFADPAALRTVPRIAVVGAGGIAVDLAHLLLQPEPGRPETEKQSAERFARELAGAAGADRGGAQITLLRRGGRIGAGIGPSTRWAALQVLRSAGVRMLTGVTCRRLTNRGLLVTRQDGSGLLIPADAVVVAAGQVENTELAHGLEAAGIPFTVIGGAATAAGLNAVRAFADGLECGTAVAAALGADPSRLLRERKKAPLP
ncbi:FAD-dependent oxidoreductase [Arthrobacter sp. Sa2BUA2]|uniref:FAD-dependent oxidoreductase n=2 Tax=Arthrobacter pullicola TaxID=2762224 RepID=A0ABR8YID0_9MICC|nr:FAD-dependent oxidoreductase [Arthrobacter pullicola]